MQLKSLIAYFTRLAIISFGIFDIMSSEINYNIKKITYNVLKVTFLCLYENKTKSII